MSFILDALRKADQQRRRHAAPTLLTLQPSAVVRKRPAYLTYALLALVLVCAGVVIGWLRPWQSGQAPARRPEPVAAAPTESKSIESKSTESRPPDAKPDQPTPGPKPEFPVQPRIDGPPPATDAAALAKPAAPPAPRVDIAAADAAGDTVIPIDKLPSSIQQELPKMAITVHAYSDMPARRLVGIGARILREGDYVAPGLQIEAITLDGMILSYKGYRFRRGVK